MINSSVRLIITIGGFYMVSQIGKMFNDSSLYGNFLTQLPLTMWNLTKSEPHYLLYTESDPGKAKRFFLIFETYYRTKGYYSNGVPKGFEMGTTSPLIKYAELAVHKVGGALLTAAACGVAAPLGFVIKIIHRVALSVFRKEESPPVSAQGRLGYETPAPEELRRLRAKSGRYWISRQT